MSDEPTSGETPVPPPGEPEEGITLTTGLLTPFTISASDVPAMVSWCVNGAQVAAICRWNSADERDHAGALELRLGPTMAVRVHLETGEVTVRGEADLSEASRHFWSLVRLMARQADRYSREAQVRQMLVRRASETVRWLRGRSTLPGMEDAVELADRLAEVLERVDGEG